MENLESVQTISQKLGITPKTLYELVKTGSVPHYRIGKKIRLRLDEVLESMKVQKNGQL